MCTRSRKKALGGLPASAGQCECEGSAGLTHHATLWETVTAWPLAPMRVAVAALLAALLLGAVPAATQAQPPTPSPSPSAPVLVWGETLSAAALWLINRAVPGDTLVPRPSTAVEVGRPVYPPPTPSRTIPPPCRSAPVPCLLCVGLRVCASGLSGVLARLACSTSFPVFQRWHCRPLVA